jgi:hypothetical protein
MTLPEVRPQMAVYDRWWPYRVGYVIKKLKTRIRVEWSNGEIWTYDQAHLQFLNPLHGKS